MRAATFEALRARRGRPSGPWRSIADMVSVAYLVTVAQKYGLDASRFLGCIHEAWLQGESLFDGILVKRRQMTGNDGIFLITQNGRIMAQLKLRSNVLEYMRKMDLRDFRLKDRPTNMETKAEPENLMIKDLNSEARRFNLEAKVTEKSTPRVVTSKWGKEFLFSTVTIKDRSGTIKLPLWNDQVHMVSVGDLLRVENARLKRFQGELQVRADKSTRLQVVEKKR